MKLDIAQGVVATSHNFASTQCSIDPEDMRYISALLRNNYSNTVLATIREVYCNAVDATIENGNSPELIVVTVPTRLNPTFSVRDFGSGLTHDQIFNLYTKIGKSTKRDSDSKIGSFGIGRLAPLSYNKDGFTITSFVNGEKRVYYMYISEENDTKIDELFVGPTDEKNGMLISVAVNNGDIYSFHNTCQSFFQYFDVLPRFMGFNKDHVYRNNSESVLCGSNWKILSSGSSTIVMGGVGYPLSLSLCKLDDSCSWLSSVCLILTVPIGTVGLHHSRENLEYNKKTQSYLAEVAKTIAAEIKAKIEEDFSKNITCLKEAKIKFTKFSNTLPYRIFSALDAGGVFKFKGVKLGRDFDVQYFNHNGNVHTRIPFIARNFHKSADDKIRSGRAYFVLAQEKAAYVFNNGGDASKKLMNRLRGLLDKYDSIYYIDQDESIAPRTSIDGVEIFKKENHFDLVLNDVYNLSDLPEVKAPKSTQATRPAYNSEFFFHLTSSGLKKAEETEIEDSNIVKPYLKVKSRKFIGDESFLAMNFSYSRLNPIFNLCEKAFQTKVYAVSVMSAESKKFASYTDFVPFSKFIQEKWNNLDQEHKEMFFKLIQISSEVYASSESICLKSLMHAKIRIPLAQKYFDKVEQIKNDIISFNLVDVFEFFCAAHSLKDTLKLDFGEPKQTPLPNFNSIAVQILQKYPLLNYLSEYNFEMIASKIQTYVNQVDQLNP